jgi:hypothetical protein
MSLDSAKLEKVRELTGGILQARCPACAEAGGDRKGEHLRVYADGRYGCCVHPKDGAHRKRIFALAGSLRTASTPGRFTVKVASAAKPAEPARSVKEALVGCIGTIGTGISVLVDEESLPTAVSAEPSSDFRTLRTPFSDPRAYAGEEGSCDTYIYKDCESGVLSVLAEVRPPTVKQPRLPFFTADGTLSIPFDSPERYHWWKPPFEERLRVNEIIAEIRARQEEVENGAAF